MEIGAGEIEVQILNGAKGIDRVEELDIKNKNEANS